MKRERRRLAIAALGSWTGLLSTCIRAEQTPPPESPVTIEVTVNVVLIQSGPGWPESGRAPRFPRAEASALQASEVSFGKRRGRRGFLAREGGN